MTIAPVHDLRAFFSAEVDRASVRCGLETSPAIRQYLASVLASRGIGAPRAGRSIVLWLDHALAQPLEAQRGELRALGEHALYTRGFFRAHIEAEDPVYVRIGALAYGRSGALAQGAHDRADADLMQELSIRFVSVSDMLTEVSVAASLGAVVRDLVTLHDAWRRAKSPTALEALTRAGCFPSPEAGDA
jgi:hypothetical protein